MLQHAAGGSCSESGLRGSARLCSSCRCDTEANNAKPVNGSTNGGNVFELSHTAAAESHAAAMHCTAIFAAPLTPPLLVYMHLIV